MHQCRDALLWCIITVMHHRYNASTLWCIKNRMCQCDLLYILFYWYDVLRCSVMNGWCMVWCVEIQSDEWVMHSMMQCVLNGWCMGDALVVWCVMWMNEWMYEWMNEWWINERVGNVEWLCILLYFICICNMSLYLFRAFYMWRINTFIPYGQAFVVHARTRLATLAPNEFVGVWFVTSGQRLGHGWWRHRRGNLGNGSEQLSCAMAESCSAIDNDLTVLYC